MKNDDNSLKARLDSLIWLAIELLNSREEKIPLFKISSKLKSFGLNNDEIAGLIDKTPEQVAKIAYEAKRSKKKGDVKNGGKSKN